ncbi:MAG: ribose 5-phosphate isomerase A [Gemmatimonadota bacterium]
MSDRESQKRAAAERAVELVQSGMRLGLGTGSTARHVLDVIGERLRNGDLRDIVGVVTSRTTENQARALHIPIRSLDEVIHLDLAIDGADEVDPQLDLIKGLGGALLWEKIVATAAERFVVVVDDSKLVKQLGERAPIPVEVVPFGYTTHVRMVELDLNGTAALRKQSDGSPFVTDGGHYILDCRFPNAMEDPADLDVAFKSRAGVVETGLFLNLATSVIVASADGARTIQAADR